MSPSSNDEPKKILLPDGKEHVVPDPLLTRLRQKPSTLPKSIQYAVGLITFLAAVAAILALPLQWEQNQTQNELLSEWKNAVQTALTNNANAATLQSLDATRAALETELNGNLGSSPTPALSTPSEPFPPPTFTPSQTPVPPTRTPVPPTPVPPTPVPPTPIPPIYVLAPFEYPSNQVGGTGGEVIFGLRKCGETGVAQGLVGRSGIYIDQIQLICQQLNHDGSLSNMWDTPTAGGNGGEPFSAVSCPPNSFIVGITGRAGTVIDYIGTIKCANVLGHSTEINVGVGGGGGGDFELICPQGYAVTGFGGKSSAIMDRLFLGCTLIRQQ